MARVAPDANDLLVYRLNEPAGSTLYTNSGTLGSIGDLTDYGDPISGVSGIVGTGFYIPGPMSPNHDGAKGGSTIEIGPNISVSAWVYPRRFNGYGALLNKQYSTGVWSAPYLTVGLYINNSNDGRWITYITTGGTLRSIVVGTNFAMTNGRWFHIGLTWNGTTLSAYINGSLAGTSVPGGGAIDYGGTDGPWFIGDIPDTSSLDSPTAIIQDVRVANIVRPQSYFANIYYQGTFVNG